MTGRREPDRTSSALEAVDAAQRWYAELGLTVTLTEHRFDHGSALYGQLSRQDGTILAEASGKGAEPSQALASLLYELAEHDVYFRSAGVPVRRSWLRGTLRTLRLGDLAYLHAEAPLRVSYPEMEPCLVVELDGLTTDGQLLYPYELTTEDDVRTDLLNAYYGNNGMAAGQTSDEALLHALCEIAERDAVSEFLLRGCVDGEPAFRFVDPVPDDVGALLESVHRASGAQASIVELVSDIAVPCFLAFIDGDYSRGRRPIGTGASLEANHAMVRAATELLQEVVTIGCFPDEGAEDLVAARHLNPYPALRACSSLDLLVASDPPRRSDDPGVYSRPTATPSRSTVPEQLDEVVRRFRAASLDIFWTEATPEESPISVVLAVVPGAERFYRVRNGFPLDPIGRHRTPRRHLRCGLRCA